MDLHIFSEGKQTGPFSVSTISNFISQSKISLEDLGWTNGMEGWFSLNDPIWEKYGVNFRIESTIESNFDKKYWASIELGWWDKLLDEISNADCLEDLGDLNFLNQLKSKTSTLFAKATSNEVSESPAQFLVKEYNLLDKSAEACETDIVDLIESFLQNESFKQCIELQKEISDKGVTERLQELIVDRINRFKKDNSSQLSSDEIMNVWNLAGDNFGESEDLPLILDLSNFNESSDSIGTCFKTFKSEKLSNLTPLFDGLGGLLDKENESFDCRYENLLKLKKNLQHLGIENDLINKKLSVYTQKLKSLTAVKLPFDKHLLEALTSVCKSLTSTPSYRVSALVIKSPFYRDSTEIENFFVRKGYKSGASQGWIKTKESWDEFGLGTDEINKLKNELKAIDSELNRLKFRTKSRDMSYESTFEDHLEKMESEVIQFSKYINLHESLSDLCQKARKKKTLSTIKLIIAGGVLVGVCCLPLII